MEAKGRGLGCRDHTRLETALYHFCFPPSRRQVPLPKGTPGYSQDVASQNLGTKSEIVTNLAKLKLIIINIR